ncbi:MAG TPA: hypothetical protein VGZ33_03380 [Acidimicrobiales bacterium]|jgi:hypothetical protein|nr:hypothetical protein [Acidimicrobiales bacterium]
MRDVVESAADQNAVEASMWLDGTSMLKAPRVLRCTMRSSQTAVSAS